MHNSGEKKGKVKAILMMSFFLAFLWSGCADDTQNVETTEVKTTFRLSTTSALKGKISIQEAYLKLDHIEVRGLLAGQNVAAISHDIPREDGPFKLSRPDSSYVTFAMPVAPYDQIIYDLYLFQDTYELIPVVNAAPEVPSPSPAPGNNNGGDNNGEQPGATPPPGDDNSGGNEGENPGGDDQDDEEDEGQDNEGDNDNGSEDDDDDESDADDDGDDDDDDNDDGDDDEEGQKGKGKGKKKDKDNKDNKGKKGDKDDDDDNHGDRLTGTSNAGTIDLDHFFQNAKPSLVVVGVYNNNAQPLPIIFVVTGKDKITLQTPGNESIVVTTQNLAEAVFDPELWFAPIATTDIESAQRQLYQGQEVLFIHKDVNSGLYEILLAQLESSARLTFQTAPAP
jgi:hypothetical protein